ncbi:MAG: bvgS 1 [Gammaproteobacteria bacterium]|nr:bvgS 1 [Gammaproteobacteria bacterium]
MAADEDKQLRITALRNAEEILRARNRFEQELRDAKESLEKKNDELQQQREWFAVTLSSIGDAVITTNAQAAVTFLNPVAEFMTGWTSSEAAGKPLAQVFNIINELTREPIQHPVAKVLRDGCVVALANHTSLVRRDGAVMAIEDSAAPIRDLSGNLTGAVMVFHDVTSRRRAEAALSESEVRFRTIFNQAAVGIAVTDLTGRFLQVNKKIIDVFGYSSEELQKLTFLQLTHPADLAHARDTLHRLVTQSVLDAVLEKRCVRKDGAVIWSLSTITLVKDQTGKPLHLIGIVEDITNRKLAEEAQARLVAVITSSDDSIISMTLEGIVLSWNRGAEQMYGYRSDEMIGQPSRALIPLDRVEEEPAILERIRKGERIEHFETRRQRKDGVILEVSIAVSPIEDTRGNIIGASKITRDITQSKRAEAALRETDRRKDEFLATLAHELRNPLAPIRQAALISKSEGATDAQKRWSHDVISRQVHHMSLLLDDLLDISRITRGTLELRPEMTLLSEIIEAAVETARPVIDAKRHRFTIAAPHESTRIMADPLRLAQVLSNLLTNAAKYTDPEGQIELRVECTGQSVLLAVKDSGIGIPAAAVGHVFEMFSQLQSTQDRSEGGLGIGLALAKGLVDLHGGRIEARSAGLGRGSEFIVQLPRRDTGINVAKVPGSDHRHRPVSRRVLIADDNRDAAESLAMLLQIDGHKVHVVHNGRAAVAALTEFLPEFALLDIGMPELSGYEVARTARQSVVGQAITLIALTGWGQARDKVQALAAGFDHHFTKPVEPARITEILRAPSRPG